MNVQTQITAKDVRIGDTINSRFWENGDPREVTYLSFDGVFVRIGFDNNTRDLLCSTPGHTFIRYDLITDEDVANFLGTTIDDQREGVLDGDLSDLIKDEDTPPQQLAKMLLNSTYGKMMSLEEALALPLPAVEQDKAVERADYADIQRLDYLFINGMIREYGELYHKLASEYTEDMIVYQHAKYNDGVTW